MKTRIITAIVGILVLIGVLFTFDTLVFNFVIAAITLIAIHEVFKALGFGRKEWPMYAVFVPYTLLIMLSSYQVWRRLVMPASFLMVLFFGIYLVVRNAQVDFAKASGLVMFSGIVIFLPKVKTAAKAFLCCFSGFCSLVFGVPHKARLRYLLSYTIIADLPPKINSNSAYPCSA